jgi:AraC-like DNA-binding protein
LKIGKAKEMLGQHGPGYHTSITRISYSLGFESLSSFNKVFKQHVKMSPSEYASAAREIRIDIALHPLHHVPLCFIEYMGWNK